MSWFADLAGKAESLLNNLDEQTGAVLRNNNGLKEKRNDFILNNEGTWGPKKRTNLRTAKKISPLTETKSTTVKCTPPKSPQPRSTARHSLNNVAPQDHIKKRSPGRKPAPHNLNNSPKTLVGDFCDNGLSDHYGLRRRRYSLPSDLEIINSERFTYNMQNLEVENAMLKNELNVMNREVSELLDRLRKTEDELKSTQVKLDNGDKLSLMLGEEKKSLLAQIEKLRLQVSEESSVQSNKVKECNQDLESNVHILEYKNLELEDKIKTLTDDITNKETAQNKLENELRYAQKTISDQQSTIEKITAECHRLEKDWEAYKLRVKNMLHTKDNEIKSLREGANLTEDTKMLMEQIETLKEEKEDLSQSVSEVGKEYLELKLCMSQLEQRHNAAERFVTALRDTLNEERSSRNRAEAQCLSLGKELQSLRMESAKTIAHLRTALQNKEEELNNLREESTTDTSALNVADYDAKEVESDKIYYLSEMLIEKQGKIDSLLADNNILRIQLDKSESKYRSEISAIRTKNHVVHLQDVDNSMRSRNNYSGSISAIRSGVTVKRSLSRLFIIFYMIGLHMWVLAVLFTRTPEDYVLNSSKS